MQTLADALFSAMINALWMTPLLVLAVEAGTRIFGQLHGRMLYRIWISAFFLALLLPVLPAIGAHQTDSKAAAVAALPADNVAQEIPYATWQKVEDHVVTHSSQQAPAFWESSALRNLSCLLYGTCLLVALVRLQMGLAHTNRVVGDAGAALLTEDADSAWQQMVKHYQLPPVDLLSSRFLDSPAAVHWPQAIVILPQNLDGSNPDELRTIFAHELAHIRRRDFFANLVIEFLGALLYFHPALHWIQRRIAESRELATDEMAAQAMPNRTAYARNLIRLAERIHSKSILQPLCSLGIFEGGNLEKRIMKLTEKRFSIRQMMAAVASTAVLVVAVCLVSAWAGGNPFPAKPLQAKPLQQLPQQAAKKATITWDIPPELDWVIKPYAGDRTRTPPYITMNLEKEHSYRGQTTYAFQYVGKDENHHGSPAERFLDAKPYLGKRVRVHIMIKNLGDRTYPTGLTVMTPTNEFFGSGIQNRDVTAANWTSIDYVVDVRPDARSIYLVLHAQGKFKILVTEPQVEIL